MKALLENWKRFLNEQSVSRPLYKLPITHSELLHKIEQFILQTSPQPKSQALALKRKLTKGGQLCHASFGLCFDAATLMLHMAGSKAHSGLTKKRARKSPLGPDAPGAESTHWWLEDEEGNILDPTAKQFTFGSPPPYHKSQGGDNGFPYFQKGGTIYSELVPPRKVIEFAKAFRLWNKRQHGKDTAYGMDWWLEEKNK